VTKDSGGEEDAPLNLDYNMEIPKRAYTKFGNFHDCHPLCQLLGH
jgi:hypothetical protein